MTQIMKIYKREVLSTGAVRKTVIYEDSVPYRDYQAKTDSTLKAMDELDRLRKSDPDGNYSLWCTIK